MKERARETQTRRVETTAPRIVQMMEQAAGGSERARTRAQREVMRAKWGMDEELAIPSITEGSASVKEVPSANTVVETVYQGNQPIIKFRGGVDFNKGGKIPF